MYNFGLSSDQQQLSDSVRKFVDGECDLATIRSIISSPDGFAANQWRGLAEMGVLGLAIPEAYGGSDLGPTHLAAVAEELGRTVLPAPVQETIVAADFIARAGTDAQKSRWLNAINEGRCVATLAIDEAAAFWDIDSIQATATKSVNGYVLNGTKLWVPFANVADLVVCAVRISSTPDIAFVALDRVHLRGRVTVDEGIDDSYRLCELILDGIEIAEADIIGTAHVDHRNAWQRSQQLACVLSSAHLVGGMERSLAMLVAYTKERAQFGRPIGSYQAVKHRCADMLTDLEAVRGSLLYAAWALQENTNDTDIAVSSAKAFAADAAIRSGERAVQTFGAIGFTWEHDIHFYLKRAKRLESTLGDANFHREKIAMQLF